MNKPKLQYKWILHCHYLTQPWDKTTQQFFRGVAENKVQEFQAFCLWSVWFHFYCWYVCRWRLIAERVWQMISCMKRCTQSSMLSNKPSPSQRALQWNEEINVWSEEQETRMTARMTKMTSDIKCFISLSLVFSLWSLRWSKYFWFQLVSLSFLRNMVFKSHTCRLLDVFM